MTTSDPRSHDSTSPLLPGHGLTRREFLGTAVGTTVVSSLLPRVWAAEIRNGIPYRTLGNTGENVSCIGLGGYHLGMQSDENESIRIIRTGLDEGINFLDNCWDYNGGESEVRMGKALRDGYRKKAFLMTKIDARTRKGRPGRSMSPCGACRPKLSTCYSFMK